MDLKQYMFYVTAHKYVATPLQFRIVALVPIIIITGFNYINYFSPGLWKWSLSLFLFVHATMCAGDIALLNLYWVNKDKKISTHGMMLKKKKVAYFYEEL